MSGTGIGLLILCYLDFLCSRCFPFYMGYWMTRQCVEENFGTHMTATWTERELGTKIVILMISYFTWSILMAGCSF